MYPLKKQKVFEEMDNMTVVKFTQEPNIYASQWKLAGGPIQKKNDEFHPHPVAAVTRDEELKHGNLSDEEW